MIQDGDSIRRTIQVEGRIAIDSDFLEHLDWDIGDNVAVKMRGEKLLIEHRE